MLVLNILKNRNTDRAQNKRDYLMINEGQFFLFFIDETVQMRGHNIDFMQNEQKLSLITLFLRL